MYFLYFYVVWVGCVSGCRRRVYQKRNIRINTMMITITTMIQAAELKPDAAAVAAGISVGVGDALGTDVGATVGIGVGEALGTEVGAPEVT